MKSLTLMLILGVLAAPSGASADQQRIRLSDTSFELDCAADGGATCGGGGRGTRDGTFDARVEVAADIPARARAVGLLHMRASDTLEDPRQRVRYRLRLRLDRAVVRYGSKGPALAERDDVGHVTLSFRIRHTCRCVDGEDSATSSVLVTEETSPAREVKTFDLSVERDGPGLLPPGVLALEISFELSAALPPAHPAELLAIPQSGHASARATGRIALSRIA